MASRSRRSGMTTAIIEALERRQLLSGASVTVQAPAQGAVGFDLNVSAQLHGEPALDAWGQPLHLDAKFDFGDWASSLTDGALTAGADGNYASNMDHAYLQAGTYTVTVGYYQINDLIAQDQLQVTIAPRSSGGVQIAAITQHAFSGSVGTFSADSEPQQVNINWGDGADTPGSVVDLGNGTFRVDGSHTYTDPGAFTIGTYDGSGVPLITSTATVTGDPLPITGTSIPLTDHAIVGVSYYAQLADFSPIPYPAPGNPASDQANTQIDWGDGTPADQQPMGAYVVGEPYQVSGGHTFARAGLYDVTISFFEGSDLRATVHDTLQVDATGPGGVQLTPVTGHSLAGSVGTFTSTAMPDSLAPGEFPATIDWGDGRKSAGALVSLGNNQYEVDGHHTYTAPGHYAIEVNVVQKPPTVGAGLGIAQPLEGALVIHSAADVSGAAVSNDPQAGISVRGLPQPGVVSLDMYTHDLAKLSGLSPQDGIPDVEIHYLDGQHIDYGTGINVQETTARWDGNEFVVAGSAQYIDAGTYHIEVTFKSGNTVYGSVTVSVPVTQNPPGGLTINAVPGQPFTGAVETFTLGPGQQLPSQIDVSWGDNGPVSAGRIVDLGNGNYEVVSTHTFVAPGEYRVFISAQYPQAPAADQMAVPMQNRSTAIVSAPASQPPSSINAQTLRGQSVGALTEMAGESFAATLGAAAVPEDGTTVLVRWGDGTRATNGDTAADNGKLVASGLHKYRRAGHYTAVVLFKRAGKVVARMRERFTVIKAPSVKRA